MISSPDKFIMHSAIVEVFRGQEETFEYDITQIVSEMNIFEDIEIPYVSGNLVIVDSASMYSLIGFNGTERLTLRFYNNEDFPVIREFYIYSVTNYVKDPRNDGVAMYVLNFIEPHGYLSNFIRLREPYSGNISTIIERVYASELDAQLDFELSAKSAKIIAPNVTPLGFCKMIADYAYSEFGEPMYLYSTLKEGPKFFSLGSLMSREQIIPSPFVYRQFSDQNFEAKSRQIYDLSVIKNDDIIRIARSGAIRSKIVVIDPTRPQADNVFTYLDSERNRQGRELYPNRLYDSSFQIGDRNRTIDSFDSSYFSTVVPYKAFNEDLGLKEEKDLQSHTNQLSAQADREFLKKQEISIIIPGWHMLSQESVTSIGRVIDIHIPKDQPLLHTSSVEQILDKKRSGRWLISRSRHTFSVDGTYTCALSLQRTASEDRLMNEEVPPL